MTASHPALHPSSSSYHASGDARYSDHFVPNGWEAGDRGICPCGEVVAWRADGRWIPDRTLVVLILTADEAKHLRDDALMIEDLEPIIDQQLYLNTDPETERLEPLVAEPIGAPGAHCGDPACCGPLELRAMDGDR